MEEFLPLQVNSGDVEHYPFEPKDHEETLGEWTVSNAFTITASLQTQTHHLYLSYIRYFVPQELRVGTEKASQCPLLMF